MNPVGRVPARSNIPSKSPPGIKARTRRLVVPVSSRRNRADKLECDPGSVNGDGAVSARKLATRLWRRLQNLLEPTTGDRVNAALPERRNEWGFQDEPLSDSESKSMARWNPQPSLGKAEEVSDLKYRLEQARVRIKGLEESRCSCSHQPSPRKVMAAEVRLRAKLEIERRTRKRLERANSRLMEELMEAKLSVKWLGKKRELLEELCQEQAMKIHEAEELKRELVRVHKEIEEEREMVRVAEAWREGRVQMKLLDTSLALEEKYSQLKLLMANLERGFGEIEPVLDSIAEIEPVLISSPGSVLRGLNVLMRENRDDSLE